MMTKYRLPPINKKDLLIIDKEILEYSQIFRDECNKLENQKSDSKLIFDRIPLVSAFLDWIQEYHFETSEEFEDSKSILKNYFAGLKDHECSKWTLENAAFHDPNEIYEAIRCHRELSLSHRERLVSLCYRFRNFIWEKTKCYLNLTLDFDKTSVKDRALGFDEFIGFADCLKDSIQTIAKLLYFGRNQSLVEVLNLTIPDVNFHERLITYGSQVISYPLHVFADIRAIIGKRTKGKVFLGRQNAPLSPTTVFRNFKVAGVKSGLGTNVTPSFLTKTI